MEKPRIAIVGGGLGGMTVGMLLERAGHPVTIYEQARGHARVGAGINLGANTMKVMRHLGLADRMYALGIVPQRALSRLWDTGEILYEWPIARWTENYGLPWFIMHRGDFQEILFSGLKPGTVSFGHRLVGMDEKGSTLLLHFENGATAEADIVIGADGIDSIVRQILLGHEDPVYSGFIAQRGIYPTKLLGDFRVSADMTKWWWDDRLGIERHVLCYYLDHNRTESYFVTATPEPDWPHGPVPQPIAVSAVRELFEGWHPEVLKVIETAPSAMAFPMMERKPLVLWSSGNIVLLGDACHPMKPHMGQGAGMAIEDAVILFRCIQDAGEGNFADAFRLYEANRAPRTSRVQAGSQSNSFLRSEVDPGWVFGYEALNVPLIRDQI